MRIAEILVKKQVKQFASWTCRRKYDIKVNLQEITYEHVISSHLRSPFLIESSRVYSFYSGWCHTMFRRIILNCFYRASLFELLSFGSLFCLHLQANTIRDRTHCFISLSRDTRQPWPCLSGLPMGRTENIVFLILLSWSLNPNKSSKRSGCKYVSRRTISKTVVLNNTRTFIGSECCSASRSYEHIRLVVRW
jgi:hypothetical protein